MPIDAARLTCSGTQHTLYNSESYYMSLLYIQKCPYSQCTLLYPYSTLYYIQYMKTHLIIQLSTHREPVHKLCHWSHLGTDTEGCQVQNSLCSFLHWDKDRRLEWKNREYARTMGTCTNWPLIIELPDFPHHISCTYVHMFVHICTTTDQHTLILTNIAVWSKVAWRAEAAPWQRAEAFATV